MPKRLTVYRVPVQTPAEQIGPSGLTVAAFELLVEKPCCVLAERPETFLLAIAALVFAVVRNLQIDALGQEANGVGIAQAFDLHDEVDDAAALVTAEAVVHLFIRRDGKGRRFLPVEGAEAEVIRAAALQLDVLADHVLNRIAGDQLVQKRLWKGHGGHLLRKNQREINGSTRRSARRFLQT